MFLKLVCIFKGVVCEISYHVPNYARGDAGIGPFTHGVRSLSTLPLIPASPRAEFGTS